MSAHFGLLFHKHRGLPDGTTERTKRNTERVSHQSRRPKEMRQLTLSSYLWMVRTQDGVSSVKFWNVKYEGKNIYLIEWMQFHFLRRTD